MLKPQESLQYLKKLSSSLVVKSKRNVSNDFQLSSQESEQTQYNSLEVECFFRDSEQQSKSRNQMKNAEDLVNPDGFIKLHISAKALSENNENSIEARSSENFDETIMRNERLKPLFENAIELNINKIFKRIETEYPHVANNSIGGVKTCAERFFPCFYKYKQMNYFVQEKLFRLRRFCSKPFTLEINDILFTLYQEIDRRERISDSQDFSQKIGLQEINLEQEDLNKEFSVGVLIHQYYFLKNFSSFFTSFYQRPNGFKFGQKLIEETFKILGYKRIQKIFNDREYLDTFKFKEFIEIEVFFLFHSGVILIWLENFSRFNDKSIQQVVSIALKNSKKCLEVAKKAFNPNLQI